jgi:hypothetical protein
MPDFNLGQLPRDLRLFQEARKDAFELLERDPKLSSVPYLAKRLEAQMQNLRRS